MSDTSTRKAPASIAGPRRRQQFQDGELPESRKRCVVEGIESETDLAGFVFVAIPSARGAEEVCVRVDPGLDPPLLFAGEVAQTDGSSLACEIVIDGERYKILTVAQDTLDGEPVATVRIEALTYKRQPRDAHVTRLAVMNMSLDFFMTKLMSPVAVGDTVEVLWRRSQVKYYGTLTCVPGNGVAYQRKHFRLETAWRRENQFPLFVDGMPNPLPEFAKDAIALEAEVGTSVVDFEDFEDDNGPIPNRLPDGKLNEPALLALLQIREFHAALTAFYQGDAFDIEQMLALEKKALKSSSGTLSTTPQSNASLPS